MLHRRLVPTVSHDGTGGTPLDDLSLIGGIMSNGWCAYPVALRLRVLSRPESFLKFGLSSVDSCLPFLSAKHIVESPLY